MKKIHVVEYARRGAPQDLSGARPGVRRRLSQPPERDQRQADNGPLPPLRIRETQQQPAQYRRFRAPSPSPAAVIRRVAVWFSNAIGFALWVRWQQITGRLSHKQSARELRRRLEGMGNAAISAGRQIAMRMDILPLEYAAELSLLAERPTPVPLAHAVARVEAATGKPLEEVFARFDPEPIHSDSSATLYQARLRPDMEAAERAEQGSLEPPEGARVVVKVLHPEAALMLNTEQQALSVLISLLAPILPRQSQILMHIRDELAPILLEELDFTRMARLQRWFQREIRRSRVGWVSAARVYIDWTDSDVLISGFISGIRLSEVIAAVENRDQAVLASLAQQGIDPGRLGRELLHTCWWSFFENDFFCEVPDAQTIVVDKRGKLCLTSIGDTGIIGWRKRRLFMTAMERMMRHDVEGAVALILQLLLPLPHIDVYQLSKSMEGRIWDAIFRMENLDAPWWERTSTGIWMAVFATTREFGISVNLDVVRMMQSACMYDNLAGQLWPEIRVFPEFKRYLRQSTRRRAARVLRAARKAPPKSRSANLLTRLRQSEGMLQRLNLWLEGVVENVPLQSLYTSRKGSYSAAQVLRAFVWVGQTSLVIVGARWAYLLLSGQEAPIQEVAGWWLRHWIFLVYVCGVFVLTARKVIYRLEDVDDDDR